MTDFQVQERNVAVSSLRALWDATHFMGCRVAHRRRKLWIDGVCGHCGHVNRKVP